MAGFATPGLLTISSLRPKYMALIRDIFGAAHRSGRYDRVVVPGCGTFVIPHLAKQGGWEPKQMAGSDIALLSSLMAAHIRGDRVEDLHVQVQGVQGIEGLDLGDPATCAYVQMLARYQKKGEKVIYWEHVSSYLRDDSERAIADIRRQFDRARDLLGGISYRSQDFYTHLPEVLDDPRTLVMFNPPCVASGYEKFYDDGGALTWDQPTFRAFNMQKDMDELAELVRSAKALVCILEEAEPGEPSLEPFYGQASTRKSPRDPMGVRTMNSYFSSNRAEEVRDLLGGLLTARMSGTKASAANLHVLPGGHEITEASTFKVIPLLPEHAMYYRLLWTHRFVPGASGEPNWAILIDGYLAGVFGFNTGWLKRGRWGDQDESDTILAHYGIGAPTRKWRLARLLVRLMLSRECVNLATPPLYQGGLTRVRTAQFTQRPESKDKRGLMKLEDRRPDKKGNFTLIYTGPINDSETIQGSFQWWVKDELRYWSLKAKEAAREAKDTARQARKQPALEAAVA
jgi:hypothetical protein